MPELRLLEVPLARSPGQLLACNARSHRGRCLVAAVLLLIAAVCPVQATIGGLNQIVTPDIQPVGLLSLTPQVQHPALGSSSQVQIEYGVTRRFEVALLQDFEPGHLTGAVEWGLVQKPSFLLATGLLQPEIGDRLQPFLGIGHVHKKDAFTLGVIRVNDASQALIGWCHQVNCKLQILADYQGGDANYATAGFSYNLNSVWQINPAVFLSNRSPHHLYGFAALSWNVQLPR